MVVYIWTAASDAAAAEPTAYEFVRQVRSGFARTSSLPELPLVKYDDAGLYSGNRNTSTILRTSSSAVGSAAVAAAVYSSLAIWPTTYAHTMLTILSDAGYT